MPRGLFYEHAKPFTPSATLSRALLAPTSPGRLACGKLTRNDADVCGSLTDVAHAVDKHQVYGVNLYRHPTR